MEEIRIKELGEIFTGKTPPTANPNNFGTDYPFVTPVDLTSNKYIKETERSVSKTGIKHTTLVPSNSICVSCIGYIGKIGITICDSCTNQQINSIVVNEQFDIDYVYYLLNYNVPYFKEIAGVNVVAQLNKSDFSKVKLQATKSKPEQTAIATILSKVDEAIAATKNSIKAVEKLKKWLMQNLLTGKLRPDGTWRAEDEFYEDEKYGKVPLGWEVKKLKNVCLRGGEYGANASAIDFVEGNPRYIRITDIDDNGNLIEKNKAGIEKSKAKDYLLKNNDFLFARTGDTVGKSILYKEKMGLSAYAGYLIKFTFNVEEIVPEYFNLIAKSDIFEAFKVAMQRIGAKPNINSREYGSFKFPLSNNLKEQNLIFEKVNPLNEAISKKHLKIKKLQRLKKSLMQNLLTGKIRLPEEFIAEFEENVETDE